MITNFKIYESTDYPAIQFKDDYLIVHKITEGRHKGKIKIKIYEESSDRYSITYSLLSGIAILLDTKYEKNEQIRNIKVSDVHKIKTVPQPTVDLILHEFLIDIGYDLDFNKSIYSGKIKDLQIKFTDDIKNVLQKSNDLGDVFDGLRAVRDDITEFRKDHYEEYVRTTDTNKYNL